MFKGPKPAAQPRSLRSIVESKNGGGGFVEDALYNTDAGVPAATPGVQGLYSDPGDVATFGQGAGGQLPAANPLANVRGGK